MSDNEACLLKVFNPHALEQGQADRGETPCCDQSTSGRSELT